MLWVYIAAGALLIAVLWAIYVGWSEEILLVDHRGDYTGQTRPPADMGERARNAWKSGILMLGIGLFVGPIFIGLASIPGALISDNERWSWSRDLEPNGSGFVTTTQNSTENHSWTEYSYFIEEVEGVKNYSTATDYATLKFDAPEGKAFITYTNEKGNDFWEVFPPERTVSRVIHLPPNSPVPNS